MQESVKGSNMHLPIVDRLLFVVPLTDFKVTEEVFMLIRIRHHNKPIREA
jgi:hypothetical protein